MASAGLIQPVRRLPDSARSFVPAAAWFLDAKTEPRKVQELSQRRSEDFLRMNGGLLRDFGVHGQVGTSQGAMGVWLDTDTHIGALPLLSPATAKPDLGLVIEPRFSWRSAGDMLSGTGFRITPEILPISRMVAQSDRLIPPWVLSATVLMRIAAVVKQLNRRFEFQDDVLPAPKGQVQWARYVTAHVARGQWLQVPCRFPDLLPDAKLGAALHWTVLCHQGALRGQLGRHEVVRQLLQRCDSLLTVLRQFAPLRPAPGWHVPSGTAQAEVFRKGLEAIEWTADERGLGGTSDLAGLPWRMDMASFFEAWVEAIAEHAARQTGATLSTGRRQETTVRLHWQPARYGTQRSLIPDVVLHRPGVTVVIDAKYKRHAQLVGYGLYGAGHHDWQAQHRDDLLQCLAYTSLFDTPRVVACLAYPAPDAKWRHMQQEGRVLSRATVRHGLRQVEVALLAVPMSGKVEQAAKSIGELLA
ncbi:hypothetical protein [Rhodoferax sp.]|uniref:5-methylcytosine restriction system specificity protein McrC n=1 Tax=Rhodoferax sp. TaxID=50421 RepID=UPI00260D5C6C|nr:hypothetical protein [Rhodoferax sp.]MDD5480262.1 hypothetical protein [Rhodoferax sp.]